MPDLGPYFLDPNPGPPGALTYVVGAIFLVALVASLYIYLRRQALFASAPPRLRLAGIAGLVGIIVSLIGVLLALARIFQLPYVAMRVWLYADLVVGVLLLAFLVYYVLLRLPRAVAQHRREEMRQRYMPRPGDKRASRPAARKKGKGRKK